MRKDINLVVFVALHIYLVGGLLEFIGVDLSGFIGRNYVRISEGGRGLSSFAPEPSYYGITILLLLIYLNPFLNKNKWKSRYVLIIGAIQIIIMARSGLGILLFALLLLSKVSFRTSIVGFTIGLVSLFIFSSNSGFADSRPLLLFHLFMNKGLNIFLLDGSLNLRLADIIFSHLSVIENPFGHGTLPWNEYLSNLEMGAFLKSQQSRVMSYTGSFVYNYGVFSILFFMFLKNQLTSITTTFRNSRIAGILLFIIGVNAISVTLPILHMLLAKDRENILR